MKKIAKLQKAIKEQHGCDSEHLLTRHVQETFQNKLVWRGDVEVFHLKNHEAVIAYAWSYKTHSGKTHYVAVLGVPPVYTAVDAVRTYHSWTSTTKSQKKTAQLRHLLDRSESDVNTQTAEMIEQYREK